MIIPIELLKSLSEWQDVSVQRLNALPSDSAPPPESSDVGQDSTSDLEHGTARSARKKGKDPADAVPDADPNAEPPAEFWSPRWNRRTNDDNYFMKHYGVRNQSVGVKLGQAITISALLIQGPFPTEEKDQHEDHRRQVQSAMLIHC